MGGGRRRVGLRGVGVEIGEGGKKGEREGKWGRRGDGGVMVMSGMGKGRGLVVVLRGGGAGREVGSDLTPLRVGWAGSSM